MQHLNISLCLLHKGAFVFRFYGVKGLYELTPPVYV